MNVTQLEDLRATMSLPHFSVKNPVLVNMLMLVILVGGMMFALTLVREFFPESRPDKISITAVYPGVQPPELEKVLTIKVEEAVRDIEGVEKIDSSVTESVTTTIVTLLNEVNNIDAVLQEIKNAIDAIEELPDELEQITVKKLEPKLPVISVAIYGKGDEAARKRAAIALRDDLLLLPGISDVNISGIRDYEISIEVRPARLLEYDVTFDEVATAIRQSNLDISGGVLKGERSNVAIRTLGEKTRGADLEDILVRSKPDGRKIRLSDVAVIRDAFVESDLESYFNGEPGINCVVFKTRSQDAIQIAKLVKAYVAGKQNAILDPYGFDEVRQKVWYVRPFSLTGSYLSWAMTRLSRRTDLEKVYEESRAKPFDHNFRVALHTDLARFIEGRLDLLMRNGKTGLLLVMLSLILFLNWRVAFWAAIGLPVSFLGTFIVMWAFGATINLLSMFGLIIVLGIIVDDAIVIGENIYRHIEEGMPPQQAAVRGAEEVMWPVTIAILTTIVAFAPLLFIQGQIGDFMRVLPVVVLSALAVSLIEALVILPAHLSHLPSKTESDRRTATWMSRLLLTRWIIRFRLLQERMLQGKLLDAYEMLLRLALRWRYVTVAISVATLAIAWGLCEGGIVKRVFIQKMDSETLICDLEMPVGTPADQAKARLMDLVDHVVKSPEVTNVQSFVGIQIDYRGNGTELANMQSHLGQMVVELHPADVREQRKQRSSEELLVNFRKVSEQLPGTNSVIWISLHGGPGGKDIVIKTTGRDFDEIVEVSKQLKSELAGFDGVYDLDDDYDKGQREVRLRLRQSARPTGITVGMLGNHVRSAMYGTESKRLMRNREDVKIVVRYPESFRKNVYNLESMWIPATSIGPHRWVPLGEVAELTEAESYSTIHRSQQQRSVTVTGGINDDIARTPEILDRIKKTFDKLIKKAHPDVRVEFLGSLEERMKSFGSLKLAFPAAILMIYMLLAGLFRSYFQPLVVMSAIPFGLQGAIIGHWITDTPMTILSWIGMVALTGILVNDSLILVDFINARIGRGMDPFEASIQGAKLRLRAIVLTTLTTAAGLTPIMFETSFQAKFLIPMAVTLTFGLIFATALTLIVVPSLNLIFFDVCQRFGWNPNHATNDE